MKKISIIGAGIGGLTLANALQGLAGRFKVEVFERETGVHVRPQGYMLGFKDTGGIYALKTLGLYEKFRNIGHPGTSLIFLSQNGERILTLNAPKEGGRGFTHAIPRDFIRSALLENLKNVQIQWNKKVTGYETSSDKMKIRFDAGAPIETDVIVACDGVNSPIRSQMIGDTPIYLGLTAIHAGLSTKLQHPLIDAGSFMTLAPGKTLFFQNYGKTGQAIWSLGLTIKVGELDGLSPPDLKQRALREVDGWHSPVPELILETFDTNISSRKYYDKDPLRRARDGRVVLLGDAAHPMTPFRGQGANMAMMDAIELADFFKNNSDVNSALAAYEKSMLKRTKRHVLESRNGGFEFHTTSRFQIWKRDTKYRFLNWMLSKMPEQPTDKSS